MIQQCNERLKFKTDWKEKYTRLESLIQDAIIKEQYEREERLGDKLANMEMNSEYLPCIKCGLRSCEIKSIYFQED